MQTTQAGYTQPINAVEIDGRTGDPIGGYNQGYGYGQTQNTYQTSSGYGGATMGAVGAVGAVGAGHALAGHSNTYQTHSSGLQQTGYQSGYQSGYQNGYGQTTTVNSGPVYSGVHQTQVSQHQAPQIVNTVVNTGQEVIKGESRIEYVPFEKKITEYVEQPRVERVPRTVKVQEFKEEVRFEEVPREVTITDYYAVEYLRQYIPQYIPEK